MKQLQGIPSNRAIRNKASWLEVRTHSLLYGHCGAHRISMRRRSWDGSDPKNNQTKGGTLVWTSSEALEQNTSTGPKTRDDCQEIVTEPESGVALSSLFSSDAMLMKAQGSFRFSNELYQALLALSANSFVLPYTSTPRTTFPSVLTIRFKR